MSIVYNPISFVLVYVFEYFPVTNPVGGIGRISVEPLGSVNVLASSASSIGSPLVSDNLTSS